MPFFLAPLSRIGTGVYEGGTYSGLVPSINHQISKSPPQKVCPSTVLRYHSFSSRLSVVSHHSFFSSFLFVPFKTLTVHTCSSFLPIRSRTPPTPSAYTAYSTYLPTDRRHSLQPVPGSSANDIPCPVRSPLSLLHSFPFPSQARKPARARCQVSCLVVQGSLPYLAWCRIA